MAKSAEELREQGKARQKRFREKLAARISELEAEVERLKVAQANRAPAAPQDEDERIPAKLLAAIDNDIARCAVNGEKQTRAEVLEKFFILGMKQSQAEHNAKREPVAEMKMQQPEPVPMVEQPELTMSEIDELLSDLNVVADDDDTELETETEPEPPVESSVKRTPTPAPMPSVRIYTEEEIKDREAFNRAVRTSFDASGNDGSQQQEHDLSDFTEAELASMGG